MDNAEFYVMEKDETSRAGGFRLRSQIKVRLAHFFGDRRLSLPDACMLLAQFFSLNFSTRLLSTCVRVLGHAAEAAHHG